MVLYKYTVFDVECLSSAIVPHKLLHFDMPRYSWPLSETYLLGSSNKIQYHVTDLNILARANLHGSIKGAPKDQSSSGYPKSLASGIPNKKFDQVDSRCTTVVTKAGMRDLLEL